MHYSGKKINIALQVTGFKIINPYVAQYTGSVMAPSFLRGKEVKIKLTHYNAWQLRNARNLDQILSSIQRLGFETVEQFQADVDHNFASMSIRNTVAVFQGCLQSEDNPYEWGCWIGEAVGVVPTNDAIYGYVRLQSKKGASSTRVIADFLYPDQAALITDINDLKDFFARHLCESVRGVENNGNCLFRIKSKHSKKISSFWVYVARKDVSYTDKGGRERQFSIPDSLEKTWADAVVHGKQSSGLCRVVAKALGDSSIELDKPEHRALARDIADGLSTGAIRIEAIPGQRHRLMGEVLKHIHSADSHLSKTIAVCELEDGSGIGFYPMMGISQETLPASATHIKEQNHTVVINRIFHDMDSVSVKAENIPVNL